ncbi:MAG: hypothetical protein WC460_06700 [Patescibacteria group bacterium]
MTKPELKEFIKKCFLEMLTEDFIQKSVNQIIKERIVINIPTPSFKIGGDANDDSNNDVQGNLNEIPQTKLSEASSKINYQSKLSPEQRKKLHSKIVSDDGDIIDPGKVNGFINPQLRALAQDTVEHQAEKAAEIKNAGFSADELRVFDPNKALRVLDAVDKK